MRAYSIVERERAVALWEAGIALPEIAAQTGISTKSLRRYIELREKTGSLAPGTDRNKEGLAPETVAVLDRLRREHPGATLRQLAEHLEEQTGIRVSQATVKYRLSKLGVTYVRSSRADKQRAKGVSGLGAEAIRAYNEVGVGASGYPISSSRRAYPSDLTDAQWAWIKPLIPACKPGGRHEEVPRRELVNAMLYLLRNGCTWRALPHDFPAWSTVYHYFRTWRRDGVWQRVEQTLREQLRCRAGRQPTPSAAALDSQSAATTEKGGRAVSMAGSV
jgi:transposase